MKTVHKSVLIWYHAREMYALVTDVPSYPQFLPWCDHASVLEEHVDGVTAEVGIAIGAVRQTFTTRNRHTDARAVDLPLVKGPFSKLEGHWRFTPLGDGAERACRVELKLDYGFDNVTLGKLVGPVFDRIASSMVDAFVKRAQQVYGS
jgi:ribosome-associated toxin RatA of RatAB toxin-antitoxin module